MSEGRRRRTRRYEQDAVYMHDELHTEETFADEPAIIATNGNVRLTCTLAAMMSLFALFLCFAEKRSPAIRRFSVQSVMLTAVHGIVGAAMLIVGTLLFGIPILGFLINLVCWLMYTALLIVLLIVRVRMMLAAYQGVKFMLPLGEKLLRRFI